MASISSSAIIASPSTNYDIFLSFRGEDTRDSFTDHLYKALYRAGFYTFRDKDEIGIGEDLKPEIEKAIKASKTSIVVLSKNYATSTWCLEELSLILEQKREFNHFVLPVFYHVDPSDVRKQDNTFKIEVKASSKWTNDNVKRWGEALTNVANLSGEVIPGSGSETDIIAKIVDTIDRELASEQVITPTHLTGMDTRAEVFNFWLNNKQSRVDVVAICGMGGSGKTTLARYIYNSNKKYFESSSFLEEIGTHYKQPQGLLGLQNQLLADISGGKRRIRNDMQGTSLINEALKSKRILIVLDDIDEQDQLGALLGTKVFQTESRIIITTRILKIRAWCGFIFWPCEVHELKLLNNHESLELFSRYAFNSNIPMEDFKELAVQLAEYCEGNPLALKVLASSLTVGADHDPRERNSIIEIWASTLNSLRGDLDGNIQCILQRSYDSLPRDSHRELFLHIAFFFVGETEDYVVKILEDGWYAKSGIEILTNRCLLTISQYHKKLMMHRLLQEMGRKIVRVEHKDPAQRSRVSHDDDSYRVLKNGEGSKTIEGLALDMQKLQHGMRPKQMDKKSGWFSTSKKALNPFASKEKKHKSSSFNTSSLKKMDNLKLLRLNDVQFTGSYENFSECLRWLCWGQFHLKAIPSGLFQKNLVAMDMRHSNLEVFEPPVVLPSLKILNLQGSGSLLEIRNIPRLPNLGTLILCHCYQLVACESIGGLMNLSLLNMIGCRSLPWNSIVSNIRLEASTSGGGIPQQTSFTLPHSLVRLSLSGCNLECSDYLPLSFSDQPRLQYLDLGGGWFESLPSYSHLENLRVFDLTLCNNLKWLLCLPNALEELYVYFCKSLEKITFESHRFTLKELGYQGCSRLTEVEGFFKLVPVAKLTDPGHLWLKKYQHHRVRLVGDDELTKNRSHRIQMLYEFDITSISLPNIKDPILMSEYLSQSPSVSFSVPPCPTNRRLKGLNVTFKYTISGEDWVWFVKIHISNGVDYMYNPIVFGYPGDGRLGIWLSYWPIGTNLVTGDEVNVSIVVTNGTLEVHECGASLVYTEDDETLEISMPRVETFEGDLSAFQLRTGAYYLCRHDFFNLMEVGRLTPGWLSILVGDTIDDIEVRGWRKTGRPDLSYPSFTKSKKS